MAINKEILFNQAHKGISTYLRPISLNEIIIEFDNVERSEGLRLAQQTLKKLETAGVQAELYDHNGKSPHIHIKNIEGLAELSKEERETYKEAFIKFYAADPTKADYSLTRDNHLIALENAIHFKRILGERPHYTRKILIGKINEGALNFVDPLILQKAKTIKENKPAKVTPAEFRSTLSFKIAEKIKITDIARQFGITQATPKLWECPFHNSINGHDLSLNDSAGLFHCFGCEASGSIIKFYSKLKELKPEFKFKMEASS